MFKTFFFYLFDHLFHFLYVQVKIYLYLILSLCIYFLYFITILSSKNFKVKCQIFILIGSNFYDSIILIDQYAKTSFFDHLFHLVTNGEKMKNCSSVIEFIFAELIAFKKTSSIKFIYLVHQLFNLAPLYLTYLSKEFNLKYSKN